MAGQVALRSVAPAQPRSNFACYGGSKIGHLPGGVWCAHAPSVSSSTPNEAIEGPCVARVATSRLTCVERGATLVSMTKQKQVALQIRSRLALKDATQKELGEVLGLSRASLSARMNGHRDFSFTELELIADFLDVQMRDLFAFEAAEVAR